MSRSAKFTVETKKRERWSDFLTNFDRNPVTGYLAKATGEQAIEQSLRNILLTNRGEVPFEPFFGSEIRNSLFELYDPRAETELRHSVEDAIKMHEPRVEVVNVLVQQPPNEPNAIIVTLVYTIINIPDEVFTFDLVITRVR